MAKRLTQTLIALFAALFTLAGAAFLVMPNSAQSVAYAEVQGSGTADSPWLVGTNSATSTTSGNANYENDVKAWVTENAKENEEDATTYTLHIKPTKTGAYMLSFGSWDTTAWMDSTYKTAITLVEFNMTEGTLLNIGGYAFDGCAGLTNVTIPDSVINIGNTAFQNCTGLTSVVIPDSVTSIGNGAFRGCNGLTGVYYTGDVADWCNIPFIGYFSNPLFYAHKLYINDTLVENLVIPDSVTGIRQYAFYNCSSLTSVAIPDSVTSIESGAFYGCTGLTGDLTIPAGVTSIGDNAFYHCTRLTSVTIPRSVTSIGNATFSSCSGLTSVEIPDSVTSIGENVFSGCTGLTSVTIPDSVTSIGSSAFRDCNRLTSVTIGEAVTSIRSYVFAGCDRLRSVYYTGDVAGWCNISFSEYSSNPFSNHYGNLYIDNILVENLVIPDSVTSIRQYAFRGCSSLTSVVIPDSVTSIGSAAFYNCSGLTSVTIPGSVTSIGEWAFAYCPGLTSVTIPDSVTSIGNAAFIACTGLMNVVIGDSVTSIGEFAFNSCTGLTSVIISDSVTSIGRRAFMHCRGLTSVVIPDSVTSIESEAFYNCSSLTRVVIGNSVTRIGEYVFMLCTGLTSVYYTGDVAGWCNISFSSDSSNPLFYAHNLYLNDTLVENLVIPDSVTSIRQYAFYGCSGLNSAVIPDSVTSIGSNAFYGCTNLKTVINLSDLDIVAGADTYGYVAKYADKVANAKIGVNISIDASYQTGLNYYVLPEMEVAFEIDGRQYTPECTDYTVADVTYHRYSLTNVAPEDMDKTVTVKFTQDGVEFTRECSVKSYLETLAATIPTYAKLTSATLSYGAAMQAYTGKEVDSANLPTEFSGTAPEATNVNKTEDDDNKFTGASVKFTGNEYKLKFRYESAENATISATVGGEEVQVTIANGVITLGTGILPAQINSIVVVTITVGEEERASITYSVLDYVARIHAKSTDDNMKAVVVGMYNLYYEITQLLGEGA